MKHEIKKISKIIDELVTYFLYTYKTDIEIRLSRGEHCYTLDLNCRDINISDEDYQRLTQKLQVARKPELEDYYWQLSGETEDSNELMLIAMMSDKIELQRSGTDLAIHIERRYESPRKRGR